MIEMAVKPGSDSHLQMFTLDSLSSEAPCLHDYHLISNEIFPGPTSFNPSPVDYDDLWGAIQELWVGLSEQEKIELADVAAVKYSEFWRQMKAKLATVTYSKQTENEASPASAKRGRKPSQLPVLAPMPTELTRCSPFFPFTPKSPQKITFAEDIVISKNSWGTITYRGPRLTTSHEDLLLVTLAEVADKNKRQDYTHEGLSTYTYTGSLRELLVAKGNKNPNSNDYEAALEYFKDMTGAVVSLLDSKGRTKAFSAMIIGGKRLGDGSFSVIVNPYFAEAVVARQVTWSDIRLRMSIRSPYGKAVYRFISGHRCNWRGSLALLCQSLNTPKTWKHHEQREKLSPAIRELIKLGILARDSRINGNTVTLSKGKNP
ncbi:MAG: hypothetical protein H7X83_09760 [Verrucomicrobia bacterium]|nr:hypothetical protein [Deltaproteobacteria bacterium]